MDDIKKTITERIRSAHLTYIAATFSALNWKAFFVLYNANGTPQARLSEFEQHTDIWFAIIIPVVLGIIITAATPGIKLIIALCSEWFIRKKIKLEYERQAWISSEMEKFDMEFSKSEAVRDKAIFERAKDIQLRLNELDSDEARQIYLSELEAARLELERKRQSTYKELHAPSNIKAKYIGQPTIKNVTQPQDTT